MFAGLLLAAATGIGFLQPLVIQEITDKGMLAQDLPVLCWAVTVLALLVLLNQAVEMTQRVGASPWAIWRTMWWRPTKAAATLPGRKP